MSQNTATPDRNDELPKGWNYNPSSWQQRMPIVLLAIVAMFIAFYLASYHFGWIDHVWDPVFGKGTEKVLDSPVSKMFPVSDALLGALGYLGDWTFGLVGDRKRYKTLPWAVVIFGIFIVPFGGTSIALGLIMPSIVGNWCFLCIINTIIAIVMIPMSWDEVWLSLRSIQSMMKNGASFWDAFLGRAAHLSDY